METGIHIGSTNEEIGRVGELIIEILELDESDFIKEVALQALSKVAKVENVTVSGSAIHGDKVVNFGEEKKE